ncbi:MAG: 4-phosphopantetheinyl transferase family protein [Syntrophaceae bacterium]|nr:4-phosphopantetheinyl transferase family protein [Syntrophaceae bacterium]
MGKSGDSRFLKKILTDAEIEFLKDTENPDAALWSLWAGKETAYKVIKKSFPDAAFIPRRWQSVFTMFQSKFSEAEVIIPEMESVFVRLFANPQYVHCIGANSFAALDNIIWNVEQLPEEEINPSLYSRRCLALSLAQYFSLELDQIKIKREKQNGQLQPPCVYIGGQKTDIDVSLSHDGCFAAYAILYPPFIQKGDTGGFNKTY